jgi:hypothetical protein
LVESLAEFTSVVGILLGGHFQQFADIVNVSLELGVRVNPLFMYGDFLERGLGGLIVIPESGLGGYFFQFRDCFSATIEVKDTSLVFPVFLSIPAGCS